MAVCLTSLSSKVNDSEVEFWILKTELCKLGHSGQGTNSGPEFFRENYMEISVRSGHLLINIAPGPVLKCAPRHDSMFDFIIVKS